MPANLNGVVAVGVVLGAGLAAKFVTLANVNRALGGGIVLGLAICAISATHHLWMACAVLVVVGAGGGFFVVPLNALLQEKGQETVGAGHAVAVQNLAENTAMLLMIGVYILLEKAAPARAWSRSHSAGRFLSRSSRFSSIECVIRGKLQTAQRPPKERLCEVHRKG